jgi:PAS domain S-box-containing protein
MTRSPFRFPLAEASAVLGIFFGAWLIHNTFPSASDTPNLGFLGIGALDILLCFGLLGYLQRARLRKGEPLPKSWIVAGAVLIACFVGWIAALFLDADRLLALQQHHNEYVQQLARLEDSLRHFGDVVPAENPVAGATRLADPSAGRNAWQINHDRYARLHDQLYASLRSSPAWDKELTRIDDEVQQMHKLLNLILAEHDPLTPNPSSRGRGETDRLKWRKDFQQARERAVLQTEALRSDIAQGERGLVFTYRARWHAVGASAMTGVVLLLACLLFWLLFDRELRRSWKAQARLAGDEAHFRWLVEKQSEPIAVVDSAANILYVNPAWKSAFGYELDELQNGNLLELIHAEDRPSIQTAMQSNDVHHAIACRLRADYGIWHEVEMLCQPHDGAGTSVVRVHDVRETPDLPIHPQPELLLASGEKLKAAEARLAELESECAALRHRDQHSRDEAQRLSDIEEQKKSYETELREREKHLKHLDKQLRERDQHREGMEATLRDHQERLQQMHDIHQSHEASLNASKAATRRLASGVANDFNNVLSVVLGNTEVLRDNLPKDHVAQNYLDEIHQAAGRGTDLSQRLIAFSRNHLLQMVPIEMNRQLAGLESKIHVVLGPVQLQWERSEQELWVKTDPHPLEQAILHLVTHARSHMPQGGTLTIRASRAHLTGAELKHADMAPGAYIQLRLQDTGAGIDEETLTHLFEPYHPIQEGQKPDLALATAYGILRQCGGCIEVTSEKGKGSQWTILLPETAERPHQAEQETPLRASA